LKIISYLKVCNTYARSLAKAKHNNVQLVQNFHVIKKQTSWDNVVLEKN